MITTRQLAAAVKPNTLTEQQTFDRIKKYLKHKILCPDSIGNPHGFEAHAIPFLKCIFQLDDIGFDIEKLVTVASYLHLPLRECDFVESKSNLPKHLQQDISRTLYDESLFVVVEMQQCASFKIEPRAIVTSEMPSGPTKNPFIVLRVN